jgi:hypothetical protein
VRASAYRVTQVQSSVPVLGDPDAQAYRAFGVGHRRSGRTDPPGVRLPVVRGLPGSSSHHHGGPTEPGMTTASLWRPAALPAGSEVR